MKRILYFVGLVAAVYTSVFALCVASEVISIGPIRWLTSVYTTLFLGSVLILVGRNLWRRAGELAGEK